MYRMCRSLAPLLPLLLLAGCSTGGPLESDVRVTVESIPPKRFVRDIPKQTAAEVWKGEDITIWHNGYVSGPGEVPADSGVRVIGDPSGLCHGGARRRDRV